MTQTILGTLTYNEEDDTVTMMLEGMDSACTVPLESFEDAEMVRKSFLDPRYVRTATVMSVDVLDEERVKFNGTLDKAISTIHRRKGNGNECKLPKVTEGNGQASGPHGSGDARHLL